MVDSDEVTVSISKNLADKLKERAKNKGFDSLSKYITYILRQVSTNIEAEEKSKKKEFTEKDEEKVKQKLRSMGYLE